MSKRSISARSARVKRSGIYSITCEITSKVYIGAAAHLPSRWSRHRRDLKKGIHHNQALQEDYNLYGPDAFTYAVVEECPLDCLDVQEAYWMFQYDSDVTGYNVNTSFGLCRVGRKAPATPGAVWAQVFASP